MTPERISYPTAESEATHALRAHLYDALTRTEAVIGAGEFGLIAEQDGIRFTVYIVLGPTDAEPVVRYGPNGEILSSKHDPRCDRDLCHPDCPIRKKRR